MPLTDKERSGTPLETRKGARKAGKSFASLFSGPGGEGAVGLEDVFSRLQDIMGRNQARGVSDAFGFNPQLLQLGPALESQISDPQSGLDAALRPFEQRALAQGTAQLRETFGGQGGRFSDNLGRAQSQLTGELANQGARTRAENFFQGQQSQLAGLNTALNAILGAGAQSQQGTQGLLGMIANFLQPSDSFIQQGLIPGLIQAGGRIGAARLGR
jgi:hypothetical protein